MESDAGQDWNPRVARAMGFGGLALGLLVPILWWWTVRDVPFSYDEATYVELAPHPWYSSYYPDQVFVRHPPVAFLVMGAWQWFVGDSESWMRLLGTLATLGGVWFVFRAVRVREGPAWAGAAAALGGATILAPLYGVQATLYPFAFLAAAFALEGWAFGNERRERAGIALLALTHLFGFVVLFARLWIRRKEWRREIGYAALPLLWLVGAAVAVLAAANAPGPGLGPWWQPLRFFEFFYQIFTGEADAVLHVAAFAILLALLNPVLLRRVWASAKARDPWAVGAAILLVFLFTGPAFFRFGLVLMPVALVLGAGAPAKRAAALMALSAALGNVAGALYIGTGIDARAQNDVPGFVDWRAGAAQALAANASMVAAPAPTSVAFYLGQLGGFDVVDRAGGPDNLTLGRDAGTMWVLMGRSPETYRAALQPGAVLLVPLADKESLRALDEDGAARCGTISGARVYCA